MQNQETISKVLDSKTPYIPTIEFAARLGVKPTTIHRSLCVDGHYFGIVPLKLPNGRLMWPVGGGNVAA